MKIIFKLSQIFPYTYLWAFICGRLCCVSGTEEFFKGEPCPLKYAIVFNSLSDMKGLVKFNNNATRATCLIFFFITNFEKAYIIRKQSSGGVL